MLLKLEPVGPSFEFEAEAGKLLLVDEANDDEDEVLELLVAVASGGIGVVELEEFSI